MTSKTTLPDYNRWQRSPLIDATYTLVEDEREYERKAYGIDEEVESDERPANWPDGRGK